MIVVVLFSVLFYSNGQEPAVQGQIAPDMAQCLVAAKAIMADNIPGADKDEPVVGAYCARVRRPPGPRGS